jgi:tetratricopeptide (TPR) repeat protein
VGRHDWFRNVSWNDAIEDAFLRKLARAKNKNQYLRIQASVLASRCPEVALRLLDRYFALGEHFDMAQAHVVRATAYSSANDFESAIFAYEAALKRETEYPTYRTRAHLELPFLIATQRLSQHYDRAMSLLEEHNSRRDQIDFPVDRFLRNCALALIQSEQGNEAEAREAAQRALAATSEGHSGLRYHPTLGTVVEIDPSIRARLLKLAKTSRLEAVWEFLRPRSARKP